MKWNSGRNMSLLTKLVIFAAGVYAGIYADQTYQIPRADDPKVLWGKILEYASKHKKDGKSDDS